MKTFARSISIVILKSAHVARYVVSLLIRQRDMLRGVRIICHSDSKILCVRHWYAPFVWTLPGGGIQRNESGAVAAIRELREETGVLVKEMDGIIETIKGNLGAGDTTTFFYVATIEGPLSKKWNFEILESKWINEHELQKYMIPFHFKVVQKYLESIRTQGK